MTSKKTYLSLLLLSSLLLTACGGKKAEDHSLVEQTSKSSRQVSSVTSSQASSTASTEENKQTEQTQTDQVDDTTELQTTSSETAIQEAVNTAATFNGSYYAVQGKYGEVLIVNKKHPLSSSYGYGEDATALAAYQNLIADMKAQGLSVSDAFSGFRSYETQANLYQSYVATDGQAEADRYSARPGYSEHQTGLAFDVIDSNGNLLEEPVASQWLRDNAHHYGFVVRYLPGKEAVTGYMAEAWHLRYIGAEATDIAQSGLTLEEYYGVPGGDYAN